VKQLRQQVDAAQRFDAGGAPGHDQIQEPPPAQYAHCRRRSQPRVQAAPADELDQPARFDPQVVYSPFWSLQRCFQIKADIEMRDMRHKILTNNKMLGCNCIAATTSDRPEEETGQEKGQRGGGGRSSRREEGAKLPVRPSGHSPCAARLLSPFFQPACIFLGIQPACICEVALGPCQSVHIRNILVYLI